MKFTKSDSKKSRLDLVPPEALELVGFVLGNGARKYAPENWRKCPDHKRFVAAMLRHVVKYMQGEFTDRESGLLHLAHAATSALIALDLFVRIGEDTSMERKQFSYFAIVKPKGKTKRGKVIKRFRSYTKAWEHLIDNEMVPEEYTVVTVRPHQKVGFTVHC